VRGSATVRFAIFCATKPIDGGFIEKNAASGNYMGDYPTALEYDRSNITLDFAMVSTKPILRGPLYEKSSPY
jgi:hypothetical protein